MRTYILLAVLHKETPLVQKPEMPNTLMMINRKLVPQ